MTDKRRFKLPKAMDGHCHMRKGAILKTVTPLTAAQFSRAVAMGNTTPPIVTASDAVDYRNEITAACGPNFEPIMSIMLTPQITPEVVREASKAGVKVVKYIPYGVSYSNINVKWENLRDLYDSIDEIKRCDMILSLHCEVAHNAAGVDLSRFLRETECIYFLEQIVEYFPGLKIVVEHVSTDEMLEFVMGCPTNVAASFTLHHAMITWSDVGDQKENILFPHNYCAPVVKTARDRNMIIKAMTSGDPRFLFGSDSAPHLRQDKEVDTPKPGIFSAPVLLPGLCAIFEQKGALDKLGDYLRATENFYELPPSLEEVEMVEEDWVVPGEIGGIVPFLAGQTLRFKLAE